MTAYTTTGPGNWSSAGIWSPGGGPPGNGDTVSIGHAVTVDVPTTVGNSPVNGGAAVITFSVETASLTINANLTIKGPILMPASFTARRQIITQAAGVAVTFDASGAASPSATTYDVRWGGNFQRWVWKCNGTAGSHCIITSSKVNSAGNAWWNAAGFAYGGYVDWTYTEVSNLGDGTNPAVNPWLNNYVDDVFSLSHVVFDTCGQVQHQGNATFDAGNTSLTWSYVRTKNELGTYSVFISAYDPSGLANWSIDNCAFDKQANIQDVGGISVTNCSMLNTYATTSGQYGHVVDYNVFGMNTAANASGSTLITAAAGNGNYYTQTDTTTNPHWLGFGAGPAVNVTIANCVFEQHSTDVVGDAIIVNGSPSAPITVTVKNNILLPNSNGLAPGKLVSLRAAGSNYSVTAVHNTYVSGVGDEQGGCLYGENNAGFAGEYTAIKSNLAWCPTANSAVVFSRDLASNTQNVVTGGATSVDYNGKWNPFTTTNGSASPTTPTDGPGYTAHTATPMFSSTTGLGAHDVTLSANPFVDSTRNMSTWAASLGGTASVAGAFALLANRVDITQAGNASATPSNLLSWVRAGFVVTAPALNNAGHDGVTIGAMTYSAGGALSALLPKWTPFDTACYLRCLQQGTLNVGNTQQNRVNLYNLAVTNANGAATWAKWRTATNNTAKVHGNLRIWVPNVPGYVAPQGAAGAR